MYVCLCVMLLTDLDPWFGVRSAAWQQDVEMTAVTGGETIRCSRQLTDLLHCLSPLLSRGPDTYSIRPSAASLAQFMLSFEECRYSGTSLYPSLHSIVL